MNNQDVMTMWAEALKMSNDGRFDPSGKGASVHGIFAAIVLEKAADFAMSNSSNHQCQAAQNNGRQSDMAFGEVVASNFIEANLRQMAEGLKP